MEKMCVYYEQLSQTKQLAVRKGRNDMPDWPENWMGLEGRASNVQSTFIQLLSMKGMN